TEGPAPAGPLRRRNGGGAAVAGERSGFTEMMSLDISDSAQIYAAFVVYLDLLEGRNWHEVKHVGVAELQLVCLHAREREQDSLQVMVPVPVHISLISASPSLKVVRLPQQLIPSADKHFGLFRNCICSRR
uniref:tRNA splicing endonuclease subunit 15 n=1 Tax=Otus sunia TaxID=257818 RepID=A0A8C8A442_9STRI